MGGEATRDKYGPDHFRALGQKGGARTRDEHGAEHFARIGEIGGKTPRKGKNKRNPKKGET